VAPQRDCRHPHVTPRDCESQEVTVHQPHQWDHVNQHLVPKDHLQRGRHGESLLTYCCGVQMDPHCLILLYTQLTSQGTIDILDC
jgi:hypothetical protein